MNKLRQYNQLIEEIVFDFVKRLYAEENIGTDPDESDYEIIKYQGIKVYHIEIWDRYLSLDDILMCEFHQFHTSSLIKYYDECLELRLQDKKPNVNYYNYAQYGDIVKEIM